MDSKQAHLQAPFLSSLSAGLWCADVNNNNPFPLLHSFWPDCFAIATETKGEHHGNQNSVTQPPDRHCINEWQQKNQVEAYAAADAWIFANMPQTYFFFLDSILSRKNQKASCKRMKLDPYLSPCIKPEPRGSKTSVLRPGNLKLPKGKRFRMLV